jgi:hypothetical protein
MIVQTGARGYLESVIRARDLELLSGSQLMRVLERLESRYPEAVAAVLDDMAAPEASACEPQDPAAGDRGPLPPVPSPAAEAGASAGDPEGTAQSALGAAWFGPPPPDQAVAC